MGPDRSLLRCPSCKDSLDWSIGSATCNGCHKKYPQEPSTAVKLTLSQADEHWEEMQLECDNWYAALLNDADKSESYYRELFLPFKPYLNSIRGRVLDIGGGNGLVRQHIDPDVEYISLDPSSFWFDHKWCILNKAFPFLKEPLPVINAEAEHLPFADNTFDSISSFWSMNHLLDPEAAMNEIYRCLKPRGKVMMVLEYMEPNYSDAKYFSQTFGMYGLKSLLSVLKRKTQSQFGSSAWPVPSDHTRITGSQITKWTEGRFKQVERNWADGSLYYIFEKI